VVGDPRSVPEGWDDPWQELHQWAVEVWREHLTRLATQEAA